MKKKNRKLLQAKMKQNKAVVCAHFCKHSFPLLKKSFKTFQIVLFKVELRLNLFFLYIEHMISLIMTIT